MVELNQEINWVPEHVRDGSFGKWLEGARDWSISRNRFWGSPIPVWKSDDPTYPRVDVYGSLDELERDFGVRPDDLHRPAIDELVRPNPDDPTGRSKMRRVEDVLDCWFESGSMPFAQVHYPFENVEWFEGHFPGDFIVEYIGQTRGWFYTLHVLSTALFDTPAFRTCLVHGILLGGDGQKLSKRLRNYPDPVAVFDTLGADAMRWALLSSAVLRGGDLVVDRRAMEEAVRHVLMPIWNAWYFLTLYANAAGVRGSVVAAADDVLDRYALAKTHDLVVTVTARMNADDLSGAAWAVTQFLDSLNNWYIRRSRPRFWGGDQAAVDTLHTVLHALAKVTAPLLPMLSESIYRGLTGEDSVHLADWPDPATLPWDPALVTAMDQVRDVCSAASSVRKANGLRTRLPLASLTVAVDRSDRLAPFEAIIADEANVKAVVLSDDVAAYGTTVLQLVPAVLGPRVGSDVQALIRAVKAGDWQRRDDGTIVVAGRPLADDEFTLRLVPTLERASAALAGNAGVVVLDTAVTADLEAEGIARDVVRALNQIRRAEGLHVSDRVRVVIDADAHHADVAAVVEHWRDYIAREVLADELVLADRPLAEGHRIELTDGRVVHAGVHKL
jgi:isoleucyl-tRNA synthetase